MEKPAKAIKQAKAMEKLAKQQQSKQKLWKASKSNGKASKSDGKASKTKLKKKKTKLKKGFHKKIPLPSEVSSTLVFGSEHQSSNFAPKQVLSTLSDCIDHESYCSFVGFCDARPWETAWETRKRKAQPEKKRFVLGNGAAVPCSNSGVA